MDRVYSNRITKMSFLMCIGVVYIHAKNYEIYTLNSQGTVFLFEKFMENVLEVCVPMFFAISGFLFFYHFKWDKLIEKWKRRIYTLMVPYLLWSAMHFIFYAIITNNAFLRGKMNMDAVSLEPRDVINAIVGAEFAPFWFVSNLLIIVFLFVPFIYFIYVVFKDKKIGKLLIFISMVFVFFISNFGIRGLEFFFLGSIVSLFYGEKAFYSFPKRLVFIVGVAWIALCIYGIRGGGSNSLYGV